jgi:branched-chain amino acid aminotransferase
MPHDSPSAPAALPAFTFDPHPSPVDANERAQRITNPGFGRVFTDHMVTIRYSEAKGWHDARIGPREPLALDTATSVLHYAQEIFEGLKAYRLADGGTALFRPERNAARFRDSARRMAMAELPEELFLDSIRQLVRTEKEWIPTLDGGALYLRPFMFASEVFLGVKPSAEYLFAVIASSVGAYFKSGAPAVSLWISENYTRAAPGGTGAAKCGGNYASSLVAQAEAIRQGCDQVLFLDAVERRWIEELGGMNIFFVFDDGSLSTPPLTGTILPGITRDSILQIARAQGLTVREEPYAIDACRADARSGRLREAFACGTAAVVTPIGRMLSREGEFRIGSGGPGQTTQRLREALIGIQTGTAEDRHGWLERLD